MTMRPQVAEQAWTVGPWCWPRQGRTLSLLEARFGEPREPAVGQLAAVTIQGDAVALWLVSPREPGVRGATLGHDMRASWRDAGVALPRAVPLLWGDVRDATKHLPDITFLAAVRATGGLVDPSLLVDGPSFGLAFCLHLASVVLHRPIPADVVASATVDPSGLVGPVGGIERKVAQLRVLAPRVARVFVAASQREAAEAHAGPNLEVIGVSHASEAIDRVFGPELAEALIAAGADRARRETLTRSFFRVALTGSSRLVDWGPIERGARLALERWSDLGEDARYQLAFAQAVAARHGRNEGHLSMPPSSWLGTLPRMLRIQLLAHLVQQSADTGVPKADDVERETRRLLDDDLRESATEQLRLRGSLARLEAVTGKARVALDAQEQLAYVFLDLSATDDVAYPMSEWFRLAAALGDRASFGRALAHHARILGDGGYGGAGLAYTEAARVRGQLMLDPFDVEALDAAERMRHDLALPDHVRWSIHRMAGADAKEALADAAAGGNPLAARYHVLAQLDEAVLSGTDADLDRHLLELERYDPGPIGHLRRSGACPAEIARLYPY